MSQAMSRAERPKDSAKPKVKAPASESSGFDPEAFMSMNGRNMEVAAKTGQAMFDGLSAMNSELIRFISTRLKEDLVTSQTLAGCRNPSEIIDAQTEFMRTCMSQYAEEFSKLVDIAGEAAKNSWTPLEDALNEIKEN